MVVDKDVCERWWLTKMCVRDGVTKMVVDKEEERAEEEREEEREGYRIKNKNPTQRCGEQQGQENAAPHTIMTHGYM